MSTKVTVSYNEKYHFYKECWDKSNVYLEISGTEFSASNNEVMVQIPIAILREMIKAWDTSGWKESEDNVLEEWEEPNWLDKVT